MYLLKISLKFNNAVLAFLLLFCGNGLYRAQNSLNLFSTNGKTFRVIRMGEMFNEAFQAQVLLENIMKDTLNLELEFENKKKFPVKLFLLEKGLPVKEKEFNYLVDFNGVNLNLRFNTLRALSETPNPIVPKKPVIDTTKKYYNNILGHFCELKENKPSYYNNLPKNSKCSVAMPMEYMNYVAILMSKAEVQDQKFVIAENVCRNNCLNVEQLKLLLAYIDYEIERLKLVRLAYYNLVDLQNKKQLEKSFRFESSVKELNSFFMEAEGMKAKTNVSCVNAASQMLIDRYLDKLKAFSNDSERLESFKKGYADLCYSTNQAKQLLAAFLHDREKLEAAKLLYPYCIDKSNYAEVKVLFSYNQTASELNDYISKQEQRN
jgi:hypothetical protein